MVKMFSQLVYYYCVFNACCFDKIKGDLSEVLFETVESTAGEIAFKLARRSSIQCSVR